MKNITNNRHQSIINTAILFSFCFILFDSAIFPQNFFPLQIGNKYIMWNYTHNFQYNDNTGTIISNITSTSIDTIQITDSITTGGEVFYSYINNYYHPNYTENKLYTLNNNYKELSMDFNNLNLPQLSRYDGIEQLYKHLGIQKKKLGGVNRDCFTIEYNSEVNLYGYIETSIQLDFVKNIGELSYNITHHYSNNNPSHYFNTRRELYVAEINGVTYNLLRVPFIDSIIYVNPGLSILYANYNRMDMGVNLIIERKGVNESNYTQIGNISNGQTVFILNGENAVPSNLYRLKAKFNEFYSSYSNDTIVSFRGLKQDTSVKGGIYLTWHGFIDNHFKYIVERKPFNVTGNINFSPVDTLEYDQTFYLDTNFSQYKKYYYRLRLVLINGITSLSNTCLGEQRIQLSPVYNLRASINNDENILISFSDSNKVSTVTEIEMRRINPVTPFMRILTVYPPDTSIVYQMFEQDKTLQFRTKVKYESVNYAFGDTIQLYYPPFKPVNNPENLTAEVYQQNKVKLTWTDIAVNEIQYQILRGIDTSHLLNYATINQNNQEYIDNNPILYGANNIRYYGVRAIGLKKQSDIIKCKLIVTDVEDEIKPVEYNLFPNYPNPFNPNTTISYTIPSRAYVELKLYDILGKEIKTLVCQEQEQGYYKYDLNASELPSGIYLIRLNADSYSETIKIELLK